jgi:histone H3/H4
LRDHAQNRINSAAARRLLDSICNNKIDRDSNSTNPATNMAPSKNANNKRAREEEAPAPAAPAKADKPAKPASHPKPANDSKLLHKATVQHAAAAIIAAARNGDARAQCYKEANAAARYFVRADTDALVCEAAKWMVHAGRTQLKPEDVKEAARVLGIPLGSAEALERVNVTYAAAKAVARVAMYNEAGSAKLCKVEKEATELLRWTIAARMCALLEKSAMFAVHDGRSSVLVKDVVAGRREQVGRAERLVLTLPYDFNDAKPAKRARKAKAGEGEAANGEADE